MGGCERPAPPPVAPQEDALRVSHVGDQQCNSCCSRCKPYNTETVLMAGLWKRTLLTQVQQGNSCLAQLVVRLDGGWVMGGVVRVGSTWYLQASKACTSNTLWYTCL